MGQLPSFSGKLPDTASEPGAVSQLHCGYSALAAEASSKLSDSGGFFISVS